MKKQMMQQATLSFHIGQVWFFLLFCLFFLSFSLPLVFHPPTFFFPLLFPPQSLFGGMKKQMMQQATLSFHIGQSLFSFYLFNFSISSLLPDSTKPYLVEWRSRWWDHKYRERTPGQSGHSPRWTSWTPFGPCNEKMCWMHFQRRQRKYLCMYRRQSQSLFPWRRPLSRRRCRPLKFEHWAKSDTKQGCQAHIPISNMSY